MRCAARSRHIRRRAFGSGYNDSLHSIALELNASLSMLAMRRGEIMGVKIDQDRERAVATLALCFLTAVIEGMDLQSMGIAAPLLGPEFRLSKEQLGVVLLASPLGLFFGAFIGGRIADSWGRKSALVLATALFGAFQLCTAWATGLE